MIIYVYLFFGITIVIYFFSISGKDQWAQCEDCLKWRKLPLDAPLAPRWTCLDNIWDPDRLVAVTFLLDKHTSP